MSRVNNEAGQAILISIVIWGVMMLVLWSCNYFTSTSNAALPARSERDTPIQYAKFDEAKFAKCLGWAEQILISRRECVKFRAHGDDWRIYTEDTIASAAVGMAILRYKVEIGMP